MRVVFAGTPDFAVPALRALVEAGHEVAMVICQPDRPAGRGRRTKPGPVKQCAADLNLPVRQPDKLKDPATLAELRRLRPALMVVVAYGQLLTREVLNLPRHGCVNVHASLLPRWRGAAPIHRAIQAGDSETGVSIMQMAPGLDSGPVLARRAVPIEATDTAGTLHDRLAPLGAALLVDTVARLAAGDIEAVPQDERGATHAPKVTPADGRLHWWWSAAQLQRRVRAMNPWPVARTCHNGVTLRVWAAEAFAGDRGAVPGEVLAAGRAGIDVACGEGALRLTVLQRDGARRVPAGDFLNGYPLRAGERFDS